MNITRTLLAITTYALLASGCCDRNLKTDVQCIQNELSVLRSKIKNLESQDQIEIQMNGDVMVASTKYIVYIYNNKTFDLISQFKKDKIGNNNLLATDAEYSSPTHGFKIIRNIRKEESVLIVTLKITHNDNVYMVTGGMDSGIIALYDGIRKETFGNPEKQFDVIKYVTKTTGLNFKDFKIQLE